MQVQEGISGAGTGESIWCGHRREYLVQVQVEVSGAGKEGIILNRQMS
jgi:hypothetical protein